MTDAAAALDDGDRALCAAVAAWLDAHAALAAWGLALSVTAVVALIGFALPGIAVAAALLGVAGLGLAERVLALRLRFDAGLFSALAGGTLPSLAALDSTLARMALRPAAAGPRALPDRVRGTLRLLRAHRAAVVLQTVLALSAAAWVAYADGGPDADSYPMTRGALTQWIPA